MLYAVELREKDPSSAPYQRYWAQASGLPTTARRHSLERIRTEIDLFVLSLERQPEVPPAGPVLSISNSVVGSVNLGAVLGDLKVSVNALQLGGQSELADLVKQLVDRIPTAVALSPGQRREALELTRTLSEEMQKEPERRATATIRTVAPVLGSLLTRAAELAAIWQAIQPYLPLLP
jgi:hypothetical protein